VEIHRLQLKFTVFPPQEVGRENGRKEKLDIHCHILSLNEQNGSYD
jgi:hypothetical protein